MELYHEAIEQETLTDYEIERGKPMPSRNHSLVQNRLSFLLTKDYEQEFSFLSEAEISFLPKNAVPDVCIYPKMQVNFEEEDVIKMPDPPITAIEILSPKQALEDVVAKARKIYFPNGVKSVWVVMTSLKTVAVIAPGVEPKFFSSGELFDPATNVRLTVNEIFQA
jgi:Uma2 family endonuclease